MHWLFSGEEIVSVSRQCMKPRLRETQNLKTRFTATTTSLNTTWMAWLVLPWLLCQSTTVLFSVEACGDPKGLGDEATQVLVLRRGCSDIDNLCGFQSAQAAKHTITNRVEDSCWKRRRQLLACLFHGCRHVDQ